ncbi:hypothetical protein HY285_04215 [Candidatus Peregrinibacteria bacterium]|nr:hypothetical protein [Candidatus Peregrinibacteria bacterium]MBI3816718.1 hypothetical protein [Candidatus Peregrinibacteria bacterium]
MRSSSHFLLRTGLSITFLWIAVLIWRQPDAWGAIIQPWAARLLPESIHLVMLESAVLDAIVGVLLLAGFWTWLAALLGALHLSIVVLTIGFSDVTARDVGLLFAAVALFLESPMPIPLARIFLGKRGPPSENNFFP